MLKKWYISTLVIALALFGIFSQQQVVLPNQEIVVQFTNAEVTPEEIQNTADLIKKQLQDLGIGNIQTRQVEKGEFKITYFSEADVASIKKIFSKEQKVVLDFNKHNQNSKGHPLDEHPIAYNLDIYEIHDGDDDDWNLNGISIVNTDTKTNGFTETNGHTYSQNITYLNDDILIKQALKAYKNIVFKINNIYKSIPEVRAGPIC